DGADTRRLIRTGMPLGIFEDETWERDTVQIRPGGVLVLYTDGITEAQDAQGASFGEDRLLKAVSANLGRSAQGIQDGVATEIRRFVGDVPQSDDIVLAVVVRESG
ncbi:MAG: SpoIIE family protein phosphatase, partial [Pseudomonas stutzeri]|nr:SpoIIE family protein phosphatase [Stutzerimonas stutzeri]NIV34654.1 SpoIIE family protein phosphatase [Anaerolineae bacterium]